MKPHLPVTLFHALIAALASLPMAAHAELLPIPEGYTEKPINSAGEYETFTPVEGTNYAFTVANGVTLTASTGTTLLPAGSIYVQGSGSLTLQGSGAENIGYLFQGNSLTLHAEGTLTVSGFYTANTKGDAVISATEFVLSGSTSSVTFSGNTSYNRGVIAIAKDGQASISGNATVSFISNVASHRDSGNYENASLGAAIYLEDGSTLDVGNNAQISFSNNSTENGGGAIYARNSYTSASAAPEKEAVVYFHDNGTVTFANNSGGSRGYAGGAIQGADISFINNKSVEFSENSARCSGAICVSETGQLTFRKNASVKFIGNRSTSYDGGAVYADGDMNVAPELVEFSNGGTASFSENYSSGSGGAIYALHRAIKITGNKEVTFSNNGAANDSHTGNEFFGGGAIYAYGSSLEISGNDSVTFRGNYQGSSSPILRSVRLRGYSGVDYNSLRLSAAAGGHITFYDSVYVTDMDENISFNGEAGNTGDIVFSGKYVEEDLQHLMPDSSPTEDQIKTSKTSELRAQVDVHAGKLVIQDGAVVQSCGLNVKNGAALTLQTGTLDLNTNTSFPFNPVYQLYNATFEAGSSLALEGVNTIVVDTLTATDSTWSFTLSALNASEALLDFSGTLSASNLTINILGAESDALSGIRSLKLLAGATASQWAGVTWKVTGIEADKLRWDGSTLWYDLMAPGEYADIIVTAPQSLTSTELADPVNVIVRGGEATITSIIRKADAGSDLADNDFGNLTLESGTATIGEGGGLEGKVAYVDTEASTTETVRELVIGWDGLSLGEVALDAARGQNVLTVNDNNTVTVGSLTGEGGLNIRGGGYISRRG